MGTDDRRGRRHDGRGESNADIRCRTALATAHGDGRASALRWAPAAADLARWIEYHFDNQDMSHLDFRVAAKEQAAALIHVIEGGLS